MTIIVECLVKKSYEILLGLVFRATIIVHHVPGCPARFALYYCKIVKQLLSKLNMIGPIWYDIWYMIYMYLT